MKEKSTNDEQNSIKQVNYDDLWINTNKNCEYTVCRSFRVMPGVRVPSLKKQDYL